MASPAFDERLSAPLGFWIAGLVFVGFGIFEMAAGFTYVVYVPVALFLVGFFIVPLALAGRVRIRVQDGKLIAGKDELAVTTVTSITPLDREATRLRLGPQADPAALNVIRGWIGPSVMVRLSNPDPVPYWVVSSRRPDELAAAIKSERAAAKAAR
ncbi:MAG TPA: DUF3093 domain-containing protein [Mycobacteriales bacterium]|nr:DUF3093 domain-containing protein [Mycobacteriales bacterium]